jgi:hypothetical protein
MKATIWKSGPTWGIRVGNKNRDMHFSKKQEIIIINIDSIDYGFELTPRFWTTCPEIRGKQIRYWVERHSLKSGHETGIELEVIKPCKKFRLKIIRL